MNSFIADTHALAWYLTDDVKLGKNARAIFELAELVLMRIIPELHDRIIAATAKILSAKVLAKDPHIKNAVETIW